MKNNIRWSAHETVLVVHQLRGACGTWSRPSADATRGLARQLDRGLGAVEGKISDLLDAAGVYDTRSCSRLDRAIVAAFNADPEGMAELASMMVRGQHQVVAV